MNFSTSLAIISFSSNSLFQGDTAMLLGLRIQFYSLFSYIHIHVYRVFIVQAY
jgi:hypothetical protein